MRTFLLILLTSFQLFSKESIDHYLMASYKVEVSSIYQANSKNLKKGLSYNLMTFYVYSSRFNTLKYCLNISLGEGLTGSIMYLTKSNENQDCSKTLFDKRLYKTSYFYNYDVSLNHNKLILKYDNKLKKIKLLNLKNERALKLFESSLTNPVDIAIIDDNDFYPPRIKKGEFCQKVDDKCNDLITPSCNVCEGPHYSVINSNCRKRFSKICGTNNCGEKGQPACIRGFKTVELNLNYCLTDSPLGFCKEGLRVFCHNSLLICE